MEFLAVRDARGIKARVVHLAFQRKMAGTGVVSMEDLMDGVETPEEAGVRGSEK